MYITKLTKAAKLGGYDEKYGQGYWCDAENESIPVKFNSMSQDFKEGDVISCEEKLLKKSMKGIEYWQYKKVKALENASGSVLSPDNPPDAPAYHSASAQAPQPAQSGPETLLLQSILGLTKQANAKLDKLLGLDRPSGLGEPTTIPDGLFDQPNDSPLSQIDLE